MIEQDTKNAWSEALEGALLERKLLESKLLEQENLLRATNAAYACFASAATVLSFIYPDRGFRTAAALLTLALSLLVAALCMQRGSARAQRLHGEYAALSRLKQEPGDPESARRQFEEICASGEALSAHERRAALRMQDFLTKSTEKQLFGYEKFQYWFVEIALIALRILLFLVPAACIALAATGLL